FFEKGDHTMESKFKGEMTMDLEQVLPSALELTPLERVRLMERIMQSLAPHLSQNTAQPQEPKQSLYDLWQELNLPPEDIDELRRGVWEGFGNASRRDTSGDEANEESKAFPAADDNIG